MMDSGMIHFGYMIVRLCVIFENMVADWPSPSILSLDRDDEKFLSTKKEMASKVKTVYTYRKKPKAKKRSCVEVKKEELMNMKTESEPEAKKLKSEFKEENLPEIKTKAGNDYFLSSNFPKTIAKMSFKLTSLFRTVNEAIRNADELEQNQRRDLYREVHDSNPSGN